MARKKPARPITTKAAQKAKKKAAPKSAARTAVKKAVKQAERKPARKAAKPPKKTLRTAVRKIKPAAKAKAVVKKRIAKKPNLDRPRKTVADIHGIPSSLGMGAIASAAHSGGEELRDTLKKNNSTSPRLTAGDVDADWQSADSTGDEAPGGDNPTPGQDVVDEIGRALGVEYADDEELQGGAEITARDTHRWERDPSSKDDFEDED